MARLIEHMLETPDTDISYFILGEQKERFGVVKQLVAESSPVFHAMLIGSDIKEKGDVQIPDIEPDTMKIFLKFAYGGLEVSSMKADFSGWSPQTCLDVVHLADKYNVPQLMELALEQLKPTTVDNLFPALYCVTTFGADSISDQVQKIIQTDTKQVIEHPDFLDICEASLLYILRQDTVNVSEVELWQAAMSWAKRRGGEDSPTNVRKLLREPLQHLRLLTLSLQDISDYIEPSKLFTPEEIIELRKSTGKQSTEITYCSNSLKKRSIATFSRCTNYISVADLHAGSSGIYGKLSSSCKVRLTNKKMKIGSIFCHGDLIGFQILITVSLTVSNDNKPVLKYNGQVTKEPFVDLVISPDVLGWGPIELAQHVEYTISLQFEDNLPAWWGGPCSGHTFSNGFITCGPPSVRSNSFSHIKRIQFEECH